MELKRKKQTPEERAKSLAEEFVRLNEAQYGAGDVRKSNRIMDKICKVWKELYLLGEAGIQEYETLIQSSNEMVRLTAIMWTVDLNPERTERMLQEIVDAGKPGIGTYGTASISLKLLRKGELYSPITHLLDKEKN